MLPAAVPRAGGGGGGAHRQHAPEVAAYHPGHVEREGVGRLGSGTAAPDGGRQRPAWIVGLQPGYTRGYSIAAHAVVHDAVHHATRRTLTRCREADVHSLAQ